MFGYVTPLKPELKIREYEMFRGYYCGVCMHIKDTFGNLPRLTLNYDMTFLGLLLDGLHKESPQIKFQRCMAHPLKNKPMIISNKSLEYTAAMNVSLVYYKLLDDVNDDKYAPASAICKIWETPDVTKTDSSACGYHDIPETRPPLCMLFRAFSSTCFITTHKNTPISIIFEMQ